ncbi:uncharacterized protein LOC18426125 [Amborella trichopoda]|uniref:GRF-type domain-containing protein n=1 Tax=Amborella trichopoda TaxID=13333 RepID=W1NQQ0_AMBTC|nr:uncharacterized protein LOC18426125 [Amborella trichopoda]ERM98132.1 hypothetical protein AMTR_s00095p00056830 [Amborella trichopoda]|eukprot:XP_006832854.1 uncharacterized protein LOC18426125 [Amborella trichopoda]
MQRNHEESFIFLHSRPYDYKLQVSGNGVEGCPGLKDEINVNSNRVLEFDHSLYTGTYSPYSEGYHRPMYQQDFSTWTALNYDFQKVQQNQWRAIQEGHYYQMGREYSYPVESRFHYLPYKMHSQCFRPEVQFQEFQYFVVIDFEATCDREKNPHPQEIIEFPSVLVNSVTGQLEGSFQTYVKPIYHHHLTDFCKELTGIQQIQVDRGVPLGEALLMHDKWLEDKGIKHTNFAVVTWSNWDCKVMLESECRFKRIRKPPYFNRWINLKVPFHEVFGDVRCNLKEAVQRAGLEWEGRAHCGLDDARNTARLLSHLMSRGFRFSITNSLTWRIADLAMPPHGPQESIMGALLQSPDRLIGPYHLNNNQQRPTILAKQSNLAPWTEPTGPLHKAAGTTTYCYCGVMSSKIMAKKPGPKHGSFFFGCGNWTTVWGARCSYFVWASP